MIRCYLAQNEVVGFGHQLIKALIAPPNSGSPEAVQSGPHYVSRGRAELPAAAGQDAK
jgi:hypothetical protein